MIMEVNGRDSCTGNGGIFISGIFIKDRVDKEELSLVYFPTHIILVDYLKNPLQGALFHKLREIIIGNIFLLALLEDTFSHTSKELVGKQIPLKLIPSGTEELMKKTKNMLEDENDKHVRTNIGGPSTQKQMIRDENDIQVRTSTGEP